MGTADPSRSRRHPRRATGEVAPSPSDLRITPPPTAGESGVAKPSDIAPVGSQRHRRHRQCLGPPAGSSWRDRSPTRTPSACSLCRRGVDHKLYARQGWRHTRAGRQRAGFRPMVLPGPGLRDITIARLWQFAAEKPRRDDRAQDLRGPAPDREHTRIAHHSFERSIARIACRAE